jgi:phage terminase small subunit
MKSEAENILSESDLTESNKVFCREYILDWNGSRAYKVAYPEISEDAARAGASRLLTKDNIQTYIEEIQKDLEKIAGISRLKVLNEHMKLAFNSIAHLHNTWIERKSFDQLTEDQKSCIAEISTQIRSITGSEDSVPVQVEFVKIKLYDKQKALDSISKMLGYDSASKVDLSSLGEKLSITFTRHEP